VVPVPFASMGGDVAVAVCVSGARARGVPLGGLMH
jgi:hypothetical protein